ncbi:hypothetical protein LIER_38137 [Lithospermum erythrorhizon]|uniref:Uncharacterized protein n=1 Tax=Lithospermum erythrorhizon TaxID=34254 RepID=A0AAV3PWQ6_LITER
MPDHAPLPPSTAPAVALNQLPLRPPTYTPEPVVVSSSSEEDEAMSPLLKRPRLPTGEASIPSLQDAALESQDEGIDTPPSLEGNLSSSSPPSPLDQNQSLLPTANQGGVGSETPQTPSSVPFQAPGSQPMRQAMSPPGSSLPPQKKVGSPLDSPWLSQSLRRLEKTPPPPPPTTPNHA